jgi:rSAM/selenodomain-associated transferase 1
LIVLMAKRPSAGRTKTRLAAALSAETAAAVYECFLQDKITQLRGLQNVHPAIAYHPSTARDYFAALAPGFRLIEQRGADLSSRLKQVTTDVFKAGFKRLVLIDSDTVTLPPDYLQQALDRLDKPEIDVTLGPCEDGGYYAIGLKAPHLSLFDVRMSTPTVAADTLEQAENSRLQVELLPQWWDVDTPADLARLKNDLVHHSQLATAAFLKGLHV